jgi:hypothetical protein
VNCWSEFHVCCLDVGLSLLARLCLRFSPSSRRYSEIASNLRLTLMCSARTFRYSNSLIAPLIAISVHSPPISIHETAHVRKLAVVLKDAFSPTIFRGRFRIRPVPRQLFLLFDYISEVVLAFSVTRLSPSEHQKRDHFISHCVGCLRFWMRQPRNDSCGTADPELLCLRCPHSG